MTAQVKKHNVCGALVIGKSREGDLLESYLGSLSGCEIMEKKASSFAVVVEDNDERSAYDLLEMIKEHSSVMSITLVNHFFE